MQILSYSGQTLDRIAAAAFTVLENGGIIAYPTESFYALGVPATDERSVGKLFALKNRPQDKPLPVIVDSMETLQTLIKDIPPAARGLMERFWPGPLTLVFEAAGDVPGLLTGGTGRVAVRIPGDSVALSLVRKLQVPLTATSANPSTLPPADEYITVLRYFRDDIDLIIDGGRSPGGKPSTIVDVTADPPIVLRRGRIADELLHTGQ